MFSKFEGNIRGVQDVAMTEGCGQEQVLNRETNRVVQLQPSRDRTTASRAESCSSAQAPIKRALGRGALCIFQDQAPKLALKPEA